VSGAIRIAMPAWVADEIGDALHYADDASRVALAIRLARRNVDERTGGPFGAAIFRDDGSLVAAGVNVVVPQACSAAHAEIVAFAAAQQHVGRARLNDDGRRYTLATSAQPCSMCYGACFWAGIDEVVIGAKASDVGELTEFYEGPLPDDWIGELEKRGVAVRRDVLRDEAREVFVHYARAYGPRY
jgi:tRNA(Arg) A34 adenosine deaminase TadA